MITEIIWSPIRDENKDLSKNTFWKTCYRDDEITDEIRKKYPRWYVYHVKFDGLKPIMLTKFDVY